MPALARSRKNRRDDVAKALTGVPVSGDDLCMKTTTSRKRHDCLTGETLAKAAAEAVRLAEIAKAIETELAK